MQKGTEGEQECPSQTWTGNLWTGAPVLTNEPKGVVWFVESLDSYGEHDGVTSNPNPDLWGYYSAPQVLPSKRYLTVINQRICF